MTPYKIIISLKLQFGLLITFDKFSEEIEIDLPFINITISTNVCARGISWQ